MGLNIEGDKENKDFPMFPRNPGSLKLHMKVSETQGFCKLLGLLIPEFPLLKFRDFRIFGVNPDFRIPIRDPDPGSQDMRFGDVWSGKISSLNPRDFDSVSRKKVIPRQTQPSSISMNVRKFASRD